MCGMFCHLSVNPSQPAFYVCPFPAMERTMRGLPFTREPRETHVRMENRWKTDGHHQRFKPMRRSADVTRRAMIRHPLQFPCTMYNYLYTSSRRPWSSEKAFADRFFWNLPQCKHCKIQTTSVSRRVLPNPTYLQLRLIIIKEVSKNDKTAASNHYWGNRLDELSNGYGVARARTKSRNSYKRRQ